jgi:hypothetical protein
MIRSSLRSVLIAAFAVGLSAIQLQAAPASLAGHQNFTPLLQLVQGDHYPSGHLPACSNGTHYTCWYDPYGTRICGCWLGGDRPACPLGYYFSCRLGPSGHERCACY